MPIVHIHTPKANVDFRLSSGKSPTIPWVVDSLREKGARADIRPPDFFDDITPSTLRPLMLPRTSLWLQVAPDGEEALLTAHSAERGMQPILLDPVGNGKDWIAQRGDDQTGSQRPISREHDNASVVASSGRGFTLMHHIGGIVLFREHDAALELVQSFQPPQEGRGSC